MSRRMRTYYYALLGALGGLVGWQVSDLLGLSFTSNLYLSELVVGALVGLSVGLFIGLTEGALTRNPVQAFKSGAFSGLLGLGAGAVGLPLSEFLFQSTGGGVSSLENSVGKGVAVMTVTPSGAWKRCQRPCGTTVSIPADSVSSSGPSAVRMVSSVDPFRTWTSSSPLGWRSHALCPWKLPAKSWVIFKA